MKKYDSYLCGYYGMNNSGDDALMMSTAWGARQFLGAETISVSSPSQISLPHFGTLMPTLRSKQQVSGENRMRHYKQALFSRRVIFGGGSVLHNSHDINMKLDMMKLSGGSKHLALGVGIGPFKDSNAEKACSRLLNRCHFVGVRDQLSADIAKSIAPNANVVKTFDLAPLLRLNPDYQLKPVPRNGIAINICPTSLDEGLNEQRITAISNALNSLGKHYDEPVTLFSMNGHSQYGDQALIEKLSRSISKNIRVRIVKYDSNPWRLMQRLASFRAIVSMRLHGAIFGFLANTPVVSINYHPKCDEWCNDIGMPNSLRLNAKNLDENQLEYVISQAISGINELPQLTQEQAIVQSLKNWRFANVESEVQILSRYSTV